MKESDSDRFQSMLYCRDNGCLEFMGYRGKKGYGSFRFKGRRNFPAHRFAWIEKHGAIPADMCVLHRCDNPACCNVRHLFLGTNDDNVADKIAKGREARGEAIAKGKGSCITDDVVRWIRSQPKRYGIISQMAREFGVDNSTIWSIYHRQTWTHVT